jgi:hypothetical protein
MTIASFRATKNRLFQKANLTPAQAELAETRIAYTLNILDQETMSAEALACIISTCTNPTLKDTH